MDLLQILINLTRQEMSLGFLKTTLSEAIRSERFEEAAKLRDMIKARRNCLEILLKRKEEMLKQSVLTEIFEDAAKFRDEIKDLRLKINGDECSNTNSDTAALQAELRSAVVEERFENAAVIRDKIRRGSTPWVRICRFIRD